ncbi:MAG: serine hydrolase domain-containing protein [Actinomycetes bacterium]
MADKISGFCAPGLEGVREAFRENFASRGEVGAAVCIIHRGDVVVDLVGGWADPIERVAWTPDTLVDIYSAGKAIIALAALRQVDQGVIGLDDALASLWPEYAVAEKGATTVRQALSHLAGVPAVRERLRDDELLDWERMTSALAATSPWAPPGDRVVYHTNTYGHLIGEIVRRCTGHLPGVEIASLASVVQADVHVGLSPADQLRCARVDFASSVDPHTIDLDALDGDAQMVALSYFNPPGYSSIGLVNTRQWRSAQVPSTNGHATAAGLARIYQGLLSPGLLLSEELLAEAVRPQSAGLCPVLGEEVVFGLGFVPTSKRRRMGTSSTSFGHFGTGGALGFADPEHQIAFGYVMNHVIPRWQSTRNRALIDALYAEI